MNDIDDFNVPPKNSQPKEKLNSAELMKKYCSSAISHAQKKIH